MSVPLKDLRLGVSETVDIMLDATAAAFGKDKQTIAREVLTEWARKVAHQHRVIARRLAANGMQPELFGDDVADDGTSRSGKK
jgi:hypothetical protein